MEILNHDVYEEYKQIADAIASQDIEALSRSELGGHLDFARGKPYFKNYIALFKQLSGLDLGGVPDGWLVSALEKAKEIWLLFEEVKNFAKEDFPQDAQRERDTIINRMRNSYETHFSVLSRLISFANHKEINIDEIQVELQTRSAEYKKNLEEFYKIAESKLDEINTLNETIKKAAQETAVANHAGHFQKEASDHKESANKWLCGTVVLAAITVGFGWWFFSHYLVEAAKLTVAQSVQLALAKLILFSVLFSSVIWAGRIYKAHQHNYVINKHRQNALSTFETFVHSTSDEQIKNAILLQVTQCIFSAQHTGYIGEEADLNNPAPILEIIRNVGTTGK